MIRADPGLHRDESFQVISQYVRFSRPLPGTPVGADNRVGTEGVDAPPAPGANGRVPDVLDLKVDPLDESRDEDTSAGAQRRYQWVGPRRRPGPGLRRARDPRGGIQQGRRWQARVTVDGRPERGDV